MYIAGIEQGWPPILQTFSWLFRLQHLTQKTKYEWKQGFLFLVYLSYREMINKYKQLIKVLLKNIIPDIVER